jgi:16S rRNA (guanine966-N2)-methyltransferase
MRIVAGKYKGLQIDWPKNRAVRPMSELVREALFNILGPVDGFKVLDAYAGSGSVGFEALSRGADQAVAVEVLDQAVQVIRRNAAKLNVTSQHRVQAMPIEKWLKSTEDKFELIVAGPPYAELNVAVLLQLAQLLQEGGTLVVWHSSRIDPPALESIQLTDSRRYGDSSLSFYNPAR